MKAAQLRQRLRRITTTEELERVCGAFTQDWAGDHRGRRRVVKMVEAKRKKLERQSQ